MDLTEELEEDLIIVDEMSMVDMWLFFVLISKVKNGARVVFIGDPDQIPSVGPGKMCIRDRSEPMKCRIKQKEALLLML